MRYVALAMLVAVGCGHGKVSYVGNVETAQWCEANYPGQCAAHWDAAARSQPVQPRPRASWRRAVGAGLRGASKAYNDAGTVPPAPPTYHCTTDYIGGSVCSPR